MLLELTNLEAVLLDLTGKLLQRAFQRIYPRGQIRKWRRRGDAGDGRLLRGGCDLRLEEAAVSAGKDLALNRPHFLFELADAAVDIVLRLKRREGGGGSG